MEPRLDRRSTTLILAVCAGVVVFVLVLLAGALGSALDDDGERSCPVMRTAAGDYVPAGPRPCTLYGPSHSGTGAAGTNDSSSTWHGSTWQPAKTSPKAPAAKAPVAKVPAAPKAPAVKAPVVKAPPVRLSK
ncbi:hypothetical protein ABZ468_07575 [Streptomyces sp. NPDC005708]|uniref:hypothetical protein n=1 Tax=Streptomyces sp. NPDC005708 TaxID=3154564 RepID=UPI0033E1F4B0